MGWLKYTNYTKEKNNKSLIDSRWVWFIGSGNKDISLQITSTPHFGWGFETDGSNGEVNIHFWFLLKFYLSFNYIFPEWFYIKEYNSFEDKDDKPNDNKKLKGKLRTRDKGWIRTASRDISLRFHNYSMWWNIWRDDSGWSSDVPKWRHGNLDFQRLLKGKDNVTKELVFEKNDFIEMPEGLYSCKITQNKFTKKYQRWFSQSWTRFEFEFGYKNNLGEWIMTPVPHWGKGENSYDCGMDGTYSISLSNEICSL